MVDIGVLTVVAVLAVAMTVRAVRRLVRRSASFQGLAVAALCAWVAVSVWAVTAEMRHQWVQHVATGVVREVSGVPGSRAECVRRTKDMLDLSNQSGRVMYDRPTVAVLRTDTCAVLGSWLRGPRTGATVEQAQAVHVLVHESIHVRGQFDEALAECEAMALDEHVALSLGATAEGARAVARTYVEQVYPYLTAAYRTDCTSVPAR